MNFKSHYVVITFIVMFVKYFLEKLTLIDGHAIDRMLSFVLL